MTQVQARTNGDRIAPAVDAARRQLAGLGRWAADHPDELAVAAAPLLMLSAATRRHRLNMPEAVLIAELAYWGGVAVCAHYRNWKTRPARPGRLQREVTRP